MPFLRKAAWAGFITFLQLRILVFLTAPLICQQSAGPASSAGVAQGPGPLLSSPPQTGRGCCCCARSSSNWVVHKLGQRCWTLSQVTLLSKILNRSFLSIDKHIHTHTHTHTHTHKAVYRLLWLSLLVLPPATQEPEDKRSWHWGHMRASGVTWQPIWALTWSHSRRPLPPAGIRGTGKSSGFWLHCPSWVAGRKISLSSVPPLCVCCAVSALSGLNLESTQKLLLLFLLLTQYCTVPMLE